MEGLGAVGRLAVAEGADDYEEVFFRNEFREIGLGHVEDRGGETAFAGLFGGFFGEAFGGAGLRAEEDGEGREWRGRGSASGLAGYAGGAGEHAGEKAVEPGALLRTEGRGFGEERDRRSKISFARTLASAATRPRYGAARVIACPLRERIHGMTSGCALGPKWPRALAKGTPKRRWAA